MAVAGVIIVALGLLEHRRPNSLWPQTVAPTDNRGGWRLVCFGLLVLIVDIASGLFAAHTTQ